MQGHVHGVGASQVAGQYQAAALSKASAAQEAAAMKRKLLRAAEEMGGEVGPEADALMGQWRGERERSDETGEGKAGTELTYGWLALKPMWTEAAAAGNLISYRV